MNDLQEQSSPLFLLDPANKPILDGQSRHLNSNVTRGDLIKTAIIVVVAALFFWWIFGMFASLLLVQVSPVSTRATVTSRYDSPNWFAIISDIADLFSSDSSSSSRSDDQSWVDYHIVYQYRDQSERQHTSNVTVSKDVYNRLRNSASVAIHYSSVFPSMSALDSNGGSPLVTTLIAVLVLIILIPLALIGILIIADPFIKLWQYWRLERGGQLIDGTIVSSEGQTTKQGYQVKTTHQFVSPQGKTITFVRTRIRSDLNQGNLPPPQTPVKVLYASDRCYEVL